MSGTHSRLLFRSRISDSNQVSFLVVLIDVSVLSTFEKTHSGSAVETGNVAKSLQQRLQSLVAVEVLLFSIVVAKAKTLP